jgi:hypothetical protein
LPTPCVPTRANTCAPFCTPPPASSRMLTRHRAQWPQNPDHSPRTAQEIRPEEDSQSDQEEVCLQWHHRHGRRDG